MAGVSAKADPAAPIAAKASFSFAACCKFRRLNAASRLHVLRNFYEPRSPRKALFDVELISTFPLIGRACRARFKRRVCNTDKPAAYNTMSACFSFPSRGVAIELFLWSATNTLRLAERS